MTAPVYLGVSLLRLMYVNRWYCVHWACPSFQLSPSFCLPLNQGLTRRSNVCRFRPISPNYYSIGTVYQPSVHFPRFFSHYPMFSTHYLRFCTHCRRFSTHILRSSMHCLRFSSHCLRFPMHCLRFSTHGPRYPTHCLRFSTHCLGCSRHRITFSKHLGLLCIV